MKLGLNTEFLARRAARCPWVTIGIWQVLLVVALGLMSTILGDAMARVDTEREHRRGPENEGIAKRQ